MKVFISWSGTQSKALAKVLDDWLPRIIPGVKPFYSSRIKSGAMWPAEIQKALKQASCGVICITPENQHSSWLLFEAGALWLHGQKSVPVMPLLFGFFPGDQPEMPIGLFQTKRFNSEGFRELCLDIAKCSTSEIDISRVSKSIDELWPAILAASEAAGESRPTPPREERQQTEAVWTESLAQALSALLRRVKTGDLKWFIENELEKTAPGLKRERVDFILDACVGQPPGEVLDGVLYLEEIKEECRREGLYVSGTKKQLIERWVTWALGED